MQTKSLVESSTLTELFFPGGVLRVIIVLFNPSDGAISLNRCPKSARQAGWLAADSRTTANVESIKSCH